MGKLFKKLLATLSLSLEIEERERIVYSSALRLSPTPIPSGKEDPASLRLQAKSDLESARHFSAASITPTRFPSLHIVRRVCTDIGVQYFTALKKYLAARGAGETPGPQLIRELTITSTILLAHIEEIIERMKPNTYGYRRYYRMNPTRELNVLIDCARVEKISEFENLFQDPTTNHYGGWSDGTVFITGTHNSYDGLKVMDILLFLNSAKDIVLSSGESALDDSCRIGVICTDGRIDLEKESP